MNTKRNVFLWALYDFSNSLLSIVFFLYFAQWVVIDRGISDLYFNLTFTVAAILLLLTVPITGFLLDKYFRRITGLRYSTVAVIVLYSACSLSAVFEYDMAALIFHLLVSTHTYLPLLFTPRFLMIFQRRVSEGECLVLVSLLITLVSFVGWH
jgi:MFS family permease